jgi:hypothetical protein
MLEFGAGDALDEAFTRTPAARTVTPETYMRLTIASASHTPIMLSTEMSYSAAISHSQRNWEIHRPKCQRWDDMHRGSRDCHEVGPAFGLCLGCGDVGADRGTRDSPPRTTLRGSHKWAIERGIARVSSRTKGAEWSSRCCLSVCARPLWQTRGCEGAEPLHANRQRSGRVSSSLGERSAACSWTKAVG